MRGNRVFLAAILLFLPALASAEPILRVRGTTWPGGALYVSVETEASVGGTWYWAGHSGTFTPAPYGLRTALAVPLDAAQGGVATLRVELSDGTKLERKIRVERKWRPVQYLSMSADQAARYEDPRLDKEYDEITAALARLTPGPLWKGAFREPSSAPRSSPFGVRRVRNGRPAGFHRGLDYAAGWGAPVRAPADGVVALARTGYILHGNTVVLDHGEGLTTLYLHLSAIEVEEGQKVSAGQVIGKVGSTGAATGPHLHYAAYFHGVPIDPDLLGSIPAEWVPEAW